MGAGCLGRAVKPFVTSIPRESLEGTLKATLLAVKRKQELAGKR